MAKWEWFAEWKDKQVMKRGDEYNYIKDGIGHHMWEQCLTLYPQLRDKVNICCIYSIDILPVLHHVILIEKPWSFD